MFVFVARAHIQNEIEKEKNTIIFLPNEVANVGHGYHIYPNFLYLDLIITKAIAWKRDLKKGRQSWRDKKYYNRKL